MRKTFGLAAILVAVVGACSSSNSNSGSSGGKVCCSAPFDDAGISSCVCAPAGTVSQGGLTSTVTVNGSSCTVTMTYNGMSSTTMGSVVSSCTDAG
jgi:hypothetical protein